MPEQYGGIRPGGRTADTRAAVQRAVRELIEEPGVELTMSNIAARSGVHRTTIHRRWRTVESILLDVALERIIEEDPVPATGHLRADLTEYVYRLLGALRRPSTGNVLTALLAAASAADEPAHIDPIVQPRIEQFQRMLDAAGVTSIDGLRLVELVLAPAYLWAQVGAPLDPDDDTERIVATVLAVVSA